MFIDESIRDSYVMAAVVVSTQHLGQYRRAMASLRTKGSSAFHMGNERRQQRQTALVLLRDLDYIQIKRVESKARFQDFARRECLELLVSSLNRSCSWELILDRTSRQSSDQALLLGLRQKLKLSLEFSHSSRYEDVGLWGADIAAWVKKHPLK